jgi:hypothetical protein
MQDLEILQAYNRGKLTGWIDYETTLESWVQIVIDRYNDIHRTSYSVSDLTFEDLNELFLRLNILEAESWNTGSEN